MRACKENAFTALKLPGRNASSVKVRSASGKISVSPVTATKRNGSFYLKPRSLGASSYNTARESDIMIVPRRFLSQ